MEAGFQREAVGSTDGLTDRLDKVCRCDSRTSTPTRGEDAGVEAKRREGRRGRDRLWTSTDFFCPAPAKEEQGLGLLGDSVGASWGESEEVHLCVTPVEGRGAEGQVTNLAIKRTGSLSSPGIMYPQGRHPVSTPQCLSTSLSHFLSLSALSLRVSLSGSLSHIIFSLSLLPSSLHGFQNRFSSSLSPWFIFRFNNFSQSLGMIIIHKTRGF